jgi:SAM-dependent methyltransferase
MKPVGDHFSGFAEAYARFRPSYPAALGAYLASLAPGRSLAWDAGTGSGQVAVMLASEFARVVATDPSERQLSNATAHPRVEYRLGREAQVDLSDASCDLVTAGQAAHWFDMPAFSAEVRRVLKPAGVVAIWGYNHTRVADENDAIDRLIRWFQFERVGPYWPLGRERIDDEYRSLPFPFDRMEAPAFVMERSWDRASLLGYVDTWSAVARCRAAESVDPLLEFADRLRPLWPDEHERRRVWSPVHLLVGRV